MPQIDPHPDEKYEIWPRPWTVYIMERLANLASSPYISFLGAEEESELVRTDSQQTKNPQGHE